MSKDEQYISGWKVDMTYSVGAAYCDVTVDVLEEHVLTPIQAFEHVAQMFGVDLARCTRLQANLSGRIKAASR